MKKQRCEESEKVREGQRREEKRRDEKRREEKRRKKMQVREKAEKSRITVFFPMICGSGGSKSRLAIAASAESSGQMGDEKLHAVVARSAFRSQNVLNTSAPEHFQELRCRKSARCCGAKHMSKQRRTKHTNVGALKEVELAKKCTRLWREAHFEVNMLKATHARTIFGRSDVVSPGRRKGICTFLSFLKVSKTCGFCSCFNDIGRPGTFEEDLQRCISRGRRSTRDMFIRDVRRSGR